MEAWYEALFALKMLTLTFFLYIISSTGILAVKVSQGQTYLKNILIYKIYFNINWTIF